MSPHQDTSKAFMPYPTTAVAHATQGPLSGLTFGVKDLYDVAGYPTSGGQPFLLALSGIKQRHAKVVQQLLDNLGMALFDAGKRQKKRLSATGGVAGNVVKVFDPKRQPRQGALCRMRNRRCGVGHEGFRGVLVWRHVKFPVQLMHLNIPAVKAIS